jgi:integrase
VLDDDDTAAVWRAAHSIGYPFGTITQLLLLTAQRRNEVVQIRWTDLDFNAGLWSIPGPLTKNGRGHIVPLVPEVMGILRSVPRLENNMLFPSRAGEGRAFSAFSKSKERLAVRARVQAFRLHDLRRTAATRMASLGVAPHVVERLLNHTTGILGGVAGVYNRFKYREEVRRALELWTGHVRQLVGSEGFSTPTIDDRACGTGSPVLKSVGIPSTANPNDISRRRISDDSGHPGPLPR